MKKLIIAALGIVVLFGLALAQPALAKKPVKPGQIVYLVTLEGGTLTTPHDCGIISDSSPGKTLAIRFGSIHEPGCFSATFPASDGTMVHLESGAFSIGVKDGAISEMRGGSVVWADDGTTWKVILPVPLSSSDYDGKEDTDGFTVTVDSGDLTLIKKVSGKDKKLEPVTITVNLGNIVFRTHPHA